MFKVINHKKGKNIYKKISLKNSLNKNHPYKLYNPINTHLKLRAY